jgi:hypothetical protein
MPFIMKGRKISFFFSSAEALSQRPPIAVLERPLSSAAGLFPFLPVGHMPPECSAAHFSGRLQVFPALC